MRGIKRSRSGGGAVTRAANVDVFLSYNRADAAAAERLRDGLSARGLSVFFDRDYLGPGQRWQRVLETSLATCGAIAICVGPRGLGQWQQREKELALARQSADTGFPVIPVLLPGADDPGLDFLCLFSWADLRKGIDEPPDLDALVRAIRGGPAPASDRPDPRAGICPYRGLKPFREEDAAFFMGREETSAQLTARVLGGPFTMVVGASGCGKSSVAFAGLLPRLRAGAGGYGWEIAALTPGARPLHRLMAALSPPPEHLSRAQRLASLQRDVDSLRDSNMGLAAFVDDIRAAQPGTDRLLLLVDQFEELFTQCESEDDRELFIDLLLAGTARADGPLHVVLTLRGDFYGRALAHRALADRLDGAVINVGPMTREELRRAVVEPAAQVGLSFAGDLAERILDDVGNEPGNLPLLEFLLTELWRRREPDGTMTVTAYGAIGGVKRAIAARGEAELAKLNSAERETARRVLVSLVTPGEGREDTRARAIIPAADADAQSVIRRFANARLLTTDHDDALNADTVEVSHEALIREWDTLKGWVDQDREFLRTLKRVRDAMAAWAAEETDKDSRLLPPGRPLEEARELLERDDALIDDVRSFIERSIDADDARRTAEQRRVDEENRRRLADAEKLAAAERAKRRATMAGLIAALVLVGVSGLFGWWAMEQERIAEANENEALRQKEIAETNAKESVSQAELAKKRADDILRQEALRLAGLARQQTKNGDAVTGMLLALEALPDARLPDRPVVSEATGALIEAMLMQWERVVLRGHKGRVNSAELSQDGTRVVTASNDNTARIWDVETGAHLPPLRHKDRVSRAVFSPNGARVLTVSDWNVPRIWDAASGNLLFPLGDYNATNLLYAAEFSPDGRHVVTTGHGDSAARVWDAETGKQILVLRGHEERVSWAVYSQDGSRILTGSDDETARIWDAESGRELRILHGHRGRVLGGSFSHNGSKVITTSNDETTRIWDARTGGELLALQGPWDYSGTGAVATFNKDGRRALAFSHLNPILLWDTANGEKKDTLQCAKSHVNAVAFHPSGNVVIAACGDDTLRMWSAEDGSGPEEFRTGTSIGTLSFDKDGSRLVTASSETAHIFWFWGFEPGAIPRARHFGGEAAAANFSPDGEHVLLEFSNAVMRWNLKTDEAPWLTDELSDINRDHILSAVIAPTALRLVIFANPGGPVWLSDGKSGEIINTLRKVDLRHILVFQRVADFSADGSRLVTAFDSQDAHLRDGLSGEIIATLQGHEDDVTAATFSANGSKVVTSSKDGTMRLWDAENGAHLQVLQASGDGSEALALSPDGTRILEGSSDWTVRLREATSGQEITVFRGHEQGVAAAAFSPDGSLVATGSYDNTVRIWDADSGEERIVIRSHSEPISSVAFSNDGRRLITASRDETVAIWPVYRSVEDLVAEAKRRLPRRLTDEQRRRFFLQPADAR